jgi:hypothetical protein
MAMLSFSFAAWPALVAPVSSRSEPQQAVQIDRHDRPVLCKRLPEAM